MFVCDKCEKVFNRKDNYDRHVNGKRDCSKKGVFECDTCCKKFKSSQSLYNHRKKINCIPPDDIVTEDEDYTPLSKNDLINVLKGSQDVTSKQAAYIDELEKKFQELTNGQNGQNINNKINTQNNFNGDVKLVEFGKEDLSFVTDDVYKKIMNRGFNSIPHLISYIHFNDQKPEYKNVYISNMRSDHAMVFNGERWVLQNKEKVVDQLYEEKTDHLEDKFVEMKDDIKEPIARKFKRFLDRSTEPKIERQTKKEIKLLLYNNKDDIKKINRMIM